MNIATLTYIVRTATPCNCNHALMETFTNQDDAVSFAMEHPRSDLFVTARGSYAELHLGSNR